MALEQVSILPVLPPWIPVLAAPLAYIAGIYSEKLRDYIAIFASFLAFLITLTMISPVLNGQVLVYTLLSKQVSPIPIEFMADGLGLTVAIVASFAWLLATIYASEYMKHESSRNRFYLFWLITEGAALGVFLTHNLFSLYINFEVLAFASWVLVIHSETKEAIDAGKKYLFMGIGGGLFLLFAVLMTYIQAGTLDLNSLGILQYKGAITQVIFYAYFIGFGTKAGIFPLHIWLPDAHPVAPSPASALLSGVMIKAGAYGILRTIYNVFGPELVRAMGAHVVLGIVASISIVLGSAVAINEKNLKRVLAYSSISQIGYIVLGAVLLTFRGFQGSVLHLFNHVLMKDALFLSAGSLLYKTGQKNIENYHGIGRKMPITMLVFSLAALSMIGLPPLAGFMSKWYLALGALDAGRRIFFGFVLVLLLSSLLNAVYYMPIIINAFFSGKETSESIDESPLRMLIPMALLAFLIVLFGILPSIPLALINVGGAGIGLQ